MEHLRRCLPHHLKQEAGGAAPVHVIVAGEIKLYNYNYNIDMKLDRVVDRVKLWFMVHGLTHGSWF